MQQVAIPIALIFIFSYSANESSNAHSKLTNRRVMDLSMYKDVYQQKVLYKMDAKDRELLTHLPRSNNAEFEETRNITDGTYFFYNI